MTAFRSVLFPCDIAHGSRGNPEPRSDVLMMRSGSEKRSPIWLGSRRKYNTGYGLRDKDDAKLTAVIQFWEERRDWLHWFR